MKHNAIFRSLPFVLLAACGAVEDPADPQSAAQADLDPSSPSAQAPSRPTIQIEEPRPATAQAPLSSDTLTTDVGIKRVRVGGDLGELLTAELGGGDRGSRASGFVDLLEQRIVTTEGAPRHLTLELPCVRADKAVDDPSCLHTAAVDDAGPTAIRLADAEWQIALVDEHAGVEVASCDVPHQAALACELPATAGAYRAVVRIRIMTFVKSALLTLDPITIRITADDEVTDTLGPALTWDLGDATR